MNIYSLTFKGVLIYLAKRVVLLFSKVFGFKALCLALATVLLRKGLVTEDVWRSVIIAVICASSGVHVADVYSEHTGGSSSMLKKLK